MSTTTVSAARRSFETEGYYLAARPVLPMELVLHAAAGMDAVRDGKYDTGVAPEPSPWQPGDNPRKLCKIEMPQVANRAIYQLLTHPALGRLVAEITGAKMVQIWWVQQLIKPPGGAGEALNTTIGWHQDRTYWQEWEEGSDLLTAWIALSDVTLDSGPMRFVPGSHRWGLIEGSNFNTQDHAAQLARIRLPPGAHWEEVPAVLPPGGVSFHDDLTIHGSGPNFSQSLRRSFAVHLRTEKAQPKDPRRLDPAAFNKTSFLNDPRYCPVIHEA